MCAHYLQYILINISAVPNYFAHVFTYHSLGARCYPEVPACRHHSAHGDRRQYKHSQGHSHQVWHHPPRRGLPLHRWQRVQQEDPQWERRGTVTTVRDWAQEKERYLCKPKLQPHVLLFLCVCVWTYVCVCRWSRSVLTRFGLNSEFWPDLPQPTNTHSSKVNWLHYFIFSTAYRIETRLVLTLFVITPTCTYITKHIIC